MKKLKNKPKQRIDNPVEKLLGTSIGSWDEVLGLTGSKEKRKKQAGDLQEGQELDLKNLQKEDSERNKKADIEPAINYANEIIRIEERSQIRENQGIEMQLKEIMLEIKSLTDSSKELQMQFKEIAIEQHVKSPGKYHKTFFSWLLSIVKSARIKVEDSGAWLTAMQSKKKSREYGAMAKKYKSSFTLNNERTVATQVG